jgi:hypothetical protein
MDRLSKENLDDSCVEGVRGVRELFFDAGRTLFR